MAKAPRAKARFMMAAWMVFCGLVVMDAPQVNARLFTGPEADSNARREIGGEVPRPDVLWRSQLAAGISKREGVHRVSLEVQWGAKVFRNETSEDLWVSETRLRWDARLTPWAGVYGELSGRDRRQRSGARSYDTANSDLGMVLGPWGPVTLVLGGGPRLFAFWPLPTLHDCGSHHCEDRMLTLSAGEANLAKDSLLRFSNVGPGGFAALVVQLTSVEQLTASTGTDLRYFPLGWRAATLDNGTRIFDERGHPSTLKAWGDQLGSPPRRVDAGFYGDLAFESVRVLYLRAALRVMGNQSNSKGEQYLRGRMGLTAGGLLPGGVRLLMEGQIQATRWPQGLGLGERLALQEGDENQTSLGAQVSLPLRGNLWAEAKTTAYAAEFSAARTPFLRLVAFAGLSWRW